MEQKKTGCCRQRLTADERQMAANYIRSREGKASSGKNGNVEEKVSEEVRNIRRSDYDPSRIYRRKMQPAPSDLNSWTNSHDHLIQLLGAVIATT